MCCSSVVLHINMPCTCRWWCQEGKAQTEDAFDHYTEKENLDVSKPQANLRLISWTPVPILPTWTLFWQTRSTQVVMSEFPKVYVHFLLHRGFLHNILTTPCGVQRSLEAWVHFSCTTLLKVSTLNTHNLLSCFITFLQIVAVLRHCVMLLTVTSIFSYNQFCILEYRFAIGTLLQLLWECNYLWPQMPFLSIYLACE